MFDFDGLELEPEDPPERTGFAEGYGGWRVAEPEFLITPLAGAGDGLVLGSAVPDARPG